MVNRLVATALAFVFAAGCGHKADVATLGQEDEALQKNESQLIGERGSLQRERKKIADARAELVDRRKQLGHDSVGQAAIDEEERKLQAEEAELNRREGDINAKLDTLLRERNEFSKRIVQVGTGVSSADPLERAAHREQGVALREKEVGAREKELAEREKELAEREGRLAKREHETCGGAVVAAPMMEIPKGLKYAAKDVEPIYKKALKLMQERGLLAADLPPSASKLVDETRESMKKADYVRAKYDAEALLSAVEEIRIDRAFISTKMARLSSSMRGHKFEGSERRTVEQLFQEATASYGDGKFPQANGKINRLFALLK